MIVLEINEVRVCSGGGVGEAEGRAGDTVPLTSGDVGTNVADPDALRPLLGEGLEKALNEILEPCEGVEPWVSEVLAPELSEGRATALYDRLRLCEALESEPGDVLDDRTV